MEIISNKKKRKIVREFKFFIKSGFDSAYFTNAVHSHLVHWCCFRVVGSKEAFYKHYFVDQKNLYRFLCQFITGNCVEYPVLKNEWLKGLPDVHEPMCLVIREIFGDNTAELFCEEVNWNE